MKCIKCGKTLTSDDIGLHKKIVNRMATEFMCIECLSVYFNVETEKLKLLIVRFKENGCMLFGGN